MPRDPGALGTYLRARRAQVRPGDVGLRTSGTRRTPGLRREEVATLAGISADYYLRLEQGRDRHPSAQVLRALAGVLLLDATATTHLLGLAVTDAPPAPAPQDQVRPEVERLLQVLGPPAFVISRTMDVLAASDLATALVPSFRPGENRLWSVFLDDQERALYPDPGVVAAGTVEAFRASVGADVVRGRSAELVAELSAVSGDFRTLWARHDVKPLAGGPLLLDHPRVGRLALQRENLGVGDSGGQMLVVLHAAAGSESARRLARLGG